MANVVVIDDSEVVLEFTREMLEMKGHQAKITQDPEEFLQIAGQKPFPDLVIIDSVMPGIQGPELIARLRAHPDQELAYIPVILFSALDDTLPTDGGVLFLQKPFSPEQLEKIINFALG